MPTTGALADALSQSNDELPKSSADDGRYFARRESAYITLTLPGLSMVSRSPPPAATPPRRCCREALRLELDGDAARLPICRHLRAAAILLLTGRMRRRRHLRVTPEFTMTELLFAFV